ncbi:MAG: FAD-dependent monooxygenase [Chitinophagales bacterium]|nr:FAD-dependent monooxygenase [Chitinophagales bacterium]
MIKEIKITVRPEQAQDSKELERIILEKVKDHSIVYKGFRILRRSIDARKQNVLIHLCLEIFFGEDPEISENNFVHFQKASSRSPVIIVGAGPAGLFAALKLLENGVRPIIIERGKKGKDRRRDIASISKHHVVNPDSNYCFGEGGAGTYSDGKLYTRSTKKGNVKEILQLFVQHGAGEEILIDAHPHIGTNKLPRIIENIRDTILNHGGEICFETKLKDFLIQNSRIKGVITESIANGGLKEFVGDHLILATGHSARDIFELLSRKNITIEPKPFAMGVRVEHAQELIDGIQYHCRSKEEVQKQRKFLPPSAYNLVTQVTGRGVYSFCMCPGGIIAPCATSAEEIVVNGWSPSKRNNPFANSGIVVETADQDLKKYKAHGPLAGMFYQQSLEKTAWEAGGKRQTAPAQRLMDFVQGKFSQTLPQTSYQPGIKSVLLQEMLPEAISTRLQKAFLEFGEKMRGYLTNEAVIHAVESRTSSPVRIPRDKETFEHILVKGLYPVGEGAGYAGGIISAAMDGQKAAEKISEKINLLRK